MYFYYPQKFQEQAIEASRSEIVSITKLSAFSAAQAMNANNKLALEEVLFAIRQNSDIRFIVITDIKQNLVVGHNIESAIKLRYVVAENNGTLSDDGSTIMSKSEITSNNDKMGSIYIGLSLDAILEEVQTTKRNLTIFSIIILIIGMPIVFYLTGLLIRPFDRMAQTFEQISQGDFTKRVEKIGYTEIKNLANAFNHMVDHLTSAQEQLRSMNETLELRINERTKDLQQEITLHKRTETALRESEERYRTLVELAPDAIIVYSGKKFAFINSAAAKMFQFTTSQDLLLKSFSDLMSVQNIEQMNVALDQIFSGTLMSSTFEFEFMRADRSEFSAEVSVTKMLFQGIPSAQIVIRDISERIKNERQRMDLEQQLLHVQKREIIGTLASGLAHDILNILGIIGTAINKLLFLKDIDQKSLMQSAEQISKATERGRSLVRQLLSFARKSELNFDLLQINEVVAEIAAVVQRIFPQNISLEVSLANDIPLVRADNNQIHQALLNLLLNARDAIGESGKIIINTANAYSLSQEKKRDQNTEYLVITISDNGCGMSEEVLKKIYEPFFTTKDEATGSGLGLAMVKGIIENHRGFIEVESEVDKGTTFKLYFPI